MSISQNFPEEGPTLNLNFAGSKTLDPRITFSRSSVGTYMDDSGLIVTAPADAPRFDHRYVNGEIESLGLLVEEQRTNLVRNNTAQGAIVGTPGTNPTNSYFYIFPDGISREITSIGTENGITYFDVRYYGTSTSTGEISWAPQAANITPVTAGQTVTSSVYLKYISGDFTNISNLSIRILDYGPGYLRESSTSYATSLLQSSIPLRYTHTRTTGADTTEVVFSITLNKNASGPVDVTIRIGMPQLELGSFVTSVIPTSGSTVTRNPDNVSMTGTNFSDWCNLNEGTLYASASILGKNIHTTGVEYPNGICKISDTGSSLSFSRVLFFGGNSDPDRVSFGNRDSSSSKTVRDNTFGDIQSNQYYKVCGTYINNDEQALCLNGRDIILNVTGVNPPTPNQLLIGTGYNGAIGQAPGGDEMYLNGHISQLTYYPRRLTNTQLQNLTK